ncbi:MAG: ABC transporter ATP-binding protein [Thermoflexia bacterium]|nr:MAG: ABC transporter ATP-binding protein [Thermoflexia bacterium]
MPLLQIRGLTHYFGGLRAVHDFNLDLEPGELVGIIGPNGAGKTTVFNLITGVYRPTAGEILFNGHNLIGKRPDQIVALGVARTFQTIRLFQNLTVLDNVRIAHFARTSYGVADALFRLSRCRREEAEIQARAMELLDLMGLADQAMWIASSLPYGLQRRLEIARALATEPRLLLLDEPAAGMNPGEITELMELIQWIRRRFNLTIILIEHQMRVVMGICERIKVMDFGETIAEGTPAEIRNNPRVIEAYLGEEVVG